MSKNGIRIGLASIFGLAIFLIATSSNVIAQNADGEFKSLFDGKSLDGWDGNTQFWRVEDGAITGETTTENKTKGNTFIVWRGGDVENFELHLKFRITGKGGNSGIQFRSEEVSKWVMKGYQADFDTDNKWAGTLYEEKGRGVLAKRGQKVVVVNKTDRNHLGNTTEENEIVEAIKKDDWNEYKIVVQDNHIVQTINGKVTVDVLDLDGENRKMSGLLALQLHAGPPMKVQFKDIKIKKLSSIPTKKVVFVAGVRSHGYGAHEHYAGSVLLAKYLQESMPGYETVVYKDGWPKEGLAAFEGADAVIVYCDGGGNHLLNPHIEEFDTVMKKGVGLACIHYGVETPKGKTGDAFLDWIGGYFETDWSVNPHWDGEFTQFPEHAITRGVKPFKINDEWYFHMRFRPEMKGVTPILSAHPPKSTMSRGDGPHSGNPAVRKAIEQGEIQHVAWASVRENGGRGFGFTGGHDHWNWGDDNFRKVALNAIVWISHGEVPAYGVGGGPTPTREELEQNQDYEKPKPKKENQNAAKVDRPNTASAKFSSKVVTSKTPGHAVKVEADIQGAKKLFLVVSDAGNGFGCDWANWVEPKLVGPNGEKRLTELKWKSARADWGEVAIDKNCGGHTMTVAGKPAQGIGTHANSIIEYDLPTGYTKFIAQGALDGGGTNQQGGNSTSVQFQVFTKKPSFDLLASANRAVPELREPGKAVDNLDVHPDLRATLFAAEPMLLSPSNIDVDAKGRVWVCEIMNYRRHKGKRPEGDRILILEDTDGDGQADSKKVFYQGTDIDSPHGVCVLGNRVIVSAGSHVLMFTDNDGDDKPDEKKVIFQGISGVQHDHGIHAFHFGPDGKLYFNFGNEGKQLKRPDGSYVIDKAGNEVRENMKPYQQGMVFRCNLDFTEFETLGWNFRNNWMVTVDSFGTIWQSDNDDDGNRGVRINYVMEFGNYGYRDAKTGAGWQARRTGMHEQIPIRHWHQNDPGIVPNLLATGAGSPTGIMVYEGDLMPKVFHNQMIHCDPGPSVVRSYPVKDSGAGYTASIVNILEGTRDQWFRPSDVKVAPDGSLIVADWYDPGVGGHAMGDLNRGRIFRVVPKDHDGQYKINQPVLNTAEGAVAALQNPNFAVRYLAWMALHEMGHNAESALLKLWKSDNPRFRARALWLLGKIERHGQEYVDAAIKDENTDIRIVGLRLARQLDDVDTFAVIEKLASDSSAHVRRECLLALRHSKSPKAAELWADLASKHDGNDRWYLEALGIGAELHWNECLAAWKKKAGDNFNSKAARDIIWRSRADESATLLAKLVNDSNTPGDELERLFRAFDFLDGENKSLAISEIAFSKSNSSSDRQNVVLREAFDRLDPKSVNASQRMSLSNSLAALEGTDQYVKLVSQFDLKERYPSLLELAQQKPGQSVGINSIKVLLEKQQSDLIQSAFAKTESADDVQRAENVIESLGNSADNRAVAVLAEMAFNAEKPLQLRRQSARQLAKIRSGANRLIQQVENQKLDSKLNDAVAVALMNSNFDDIRKRAERAYPERKLKDVELPSIRDLVKTKGDVARGKAVFAASGTCAKCHVVGGQGKEVGPDLSQIGSKLSRQGLYESVIYPNAGISHNYETTKIAMEDGNLLTGIVVSKTDREILLKDAEGVTRTIKAADIDEMAINPISLMPSDLYKTITRQELIDVVEYLTTLKK